MTDELHAVGAFAAVSRKRPHAGANLTIDLQKSANGGFLLTETNRGPRDGAAPMFAGRPKTLTFASFAEVDGYLRKVFGVPAPSAPTRPTTRRARNRRSRPLTVRSVYGG